ncbi:MAG: hypothetical protein IJK36_05640, partial [Bacteroidales bacterium]|nr:hypothetical protein [Bacteroidales bacterium]
MKTRFTLLFMLCCIFANAQNIEVAGPQSGTWVADTVFVTDNVFVKDSLSIMPGTTVLFNGFYAIKVEKNATLN